MGVLRLAVSHSQVPCQHGGDLRPRHNRLKSPFNFERSTGEKDAPARGGVALIKKWAAAELYRARSNGTPPRRRRPKAHAEARVTIADRSMSSARTAENTLSKAGRR